MTFFSQEKLVLIYNFFKSYMLIFERKSFFKKKRIISSHKEFFFSHLLFLVKHPPTFCPKTFRKGGLCFEATWLIWGNWIILWEATLMANWYILKEQLRKRKNNFNSSSLVHQTIYSISSLQLIKIPIKILRDWRISNIFDIIFSERTC